MEDRDSVQNEVSATSNPPQELNPPSTLQRIDDFLTQHINIRLAELENLTTNHNQILQTFEERVLGMTAIVNQMITALKKPKEPPTLMTASLRLSTEEAKEPLNKGPSSPRKSTIPRALTQSGLFRPQSKPPPPKTPTNKQRLHSNSMTQSMPILPLKPAKKPHIPPPKLPKNSAKPPSTTVKTSPVKPKSPTKVGGHRPSTTSDTPKKLVDTSAKSARSPPRKRPRPTVTWQHGVKGKPDEETKESLRASVQMKPIEPEPVEIIPITPDDVAYLRKIIK